MPQELPKISGITQKLKAPETQFESVVKEATGIELPTGPQSMVLKLQEGFEVGKAPVIEEAIPKIPPLEAILGKFPALPKLEGTPSGAPSGGAETFERSGKTTEEGKLEKIGFARY